MAALARLSTVRFSVVGALSTCVLVLSGGGVVPAEGVWLLLMLPAYLVHLVITGVAVALIGDAPAWLNIVTLPLMLGSFAALDYFFWTRRKNAGLSSKASANVR